MEEVIKRQNRIEIKEPETNYWLPLRQHSYQINPRVTPQTLALRLQPKTNAVFRIGFGFGFGFGAGVGVGIYFQITRDNNESSLRSQLIKFIYYVTLVPILIVSVDGPDGPPIPKKQFSWTVLRLLSPTMTEALSIAQISPTSHSKDFLFLSIGEE